MSAGHIMSPDELRKLAYPSRREHIAVAAMQGLLAANSGFAEEMFYARLATFSVRIADALIAELDKETSK